MFIQIMRAMFFGIFLSLFLMAPLVFGEERVDQASTLPKSERDKRRIQTQLALAHKILENEGSDLNGFLAAVCNAFINLYPNESFNPNNIDRFYIALNVSLADAEAEISLKKSKPLFKVGL